MDTELTNAIASTQTSATRRQMSIAMMKYAAEAKEASVLAAMDVAVSNGKGYSDVSVPVSSVKGSNVDISI